MNSEPEKHTTKGVAFFIVCCVAGVGIVLGAIALTPSKPLSKTQLSNPTPTAAPTVWKPGEDSRLSSEEKVLFALAMTSLNEGGSSCDRVVDGKKGEHFDHNGKYLIYCANGEAYAFTAKDANSGKMPVINRPDKWVYEAETDDMTSAKTGYASIISENQVYFSSPYEGGQNGRLFIRKHPRHGTDVFLTIERGQFLCRSYEDCSILVRFDEGEPVRFTGRGPADNSTEVIFILNSQRFISKMTASKQVIIEAPVYQEGAPQFTFDVAGYMPQMVSDMTKSK